jgi:hypothetical protein
MSQVPARHVVAALVNGGWLNGCARAPATTCPGTWETTFRDGSKGVLIVFSARAERLAMPAVPRDAQLFEV